jgi:ribosomal protein S18 acetylase RimI-like enzyme
MARKEPQQTSPEGKKPRRSAASAAAQAAQASAAPPPTPPTPPDPPPSVMAAMIGETLTSALNGSADEDDEAEVEVREMDINDVARVYNLGEQIFTADRWPTLHRTWDEFEVLSLYLSDTDTCLVAEFEGQIVGFALGTLIEKRRSAWTYGYLLWLGVDQDQAGRGVGRKLVKRLTELFIQYDARMMLVDTEASNKPAIKFFEKVGFGHARQHVYLSMNLTNHPNYRRKRQQEQQQRHTRRPRKQSDHLALPVGNAPHHVIDPQPDPTTHPAGPTHPTTD